LLLRCPKAAALVPPPLRAQLLLPPGAGFVGQRAVAALHFHLLTPPSSSSSSGSGRPKADKFFLSYSLPGSPGGAGAITTAARVLTAVGARGGAGGSIPSSNSRRTSQQHSPLEAQERQLWAAKINHSGYFQV